MITEPLLLEPPFLTQPFYVSRFNLNVVLKIIFIGATGQRYGAFTHDLRNMTSKNFFKEGGNQMISPQKGSPVKGDTFYHVENGYALKERTYFGGEENNGQNEGPIMQKRFKRSAGHFFY